MDRLSRGGGNPHRDGEQDGNGQQHHDDAMTDQRDYRPWSVLSRPRRVKPAPGSELARPLAYKARPARVGTSVNAEQNRPRGPALPHAARRGAAVTGHPWC
jgi:hypothetical protein